MSIEKILYLDCSDDELRIAQRALARTACRLGDKGVSENAIGVAAFQMVVFAMVHSEGRLGTAEVLEGMADRLRSEASDHVADMEVRGEA